MNIYFTAAINAIGDLRDEYQKIVGVLEKMGHNVTSDHILKADLNKVLEEPQKSSEKYYKWMIKELTKADLLVAEVSFPSTVHVGHELTLALEKGKPVLALCKKGKKPVLFWGITNDRFFVEEYDINNIDEVLKSAIGYLTEQMDVRFNFFVSPKIVNFLDWIAKKRKMPRAVYLRRLIEDDIKKNKNYTEEAI